MDRQHRILIVDDHPTNVAILEEILAPAYQLQTAASGEEALALAPDFQPDLILLDIMMPGIDGYETCHRLRAHPGLCQTKVIMVSAKALLTERLKGYEAGADDYITKPFEEDELLAKVRVYVRLKSVEEIEQLKSNMLALLNHETRTPLNGILAPVQMLMNDTEITAADRAMFLQMVHDSATRLHALLEHVATLSAMLTGYWQVQRTPVELGDVVRSALDAVAPQATARAITLEPMLPAAAPVWLDSDQMHDVFTAVLDNALRFSPPGGQVAVRVARDDAFWCVTVTDHGEGIAPDVLPHVCEAFVSGDMAHHSSGHGLSLALAQQIVRAHEGTIGVESQPGSGTTVTVRVPSAVPTANGYAADDVSAERTL